MGLKIRLCDISRLSIIVEVGIQRVFKQLGYFVAGSPYIFLVGSIVFGLLPLFGIFRFKEVNNVRDHFSSDTSPSRHEFMISQEFFRELGGLFHVVVAMKAADGGSLLRPRYIDKALEIEDFLQYKLKVEHEGRRYAYSDFCGAQCETSDAVNIFLTMFRDVQYRQKGNVKLTFPTMDVFGHRIYLANNIFQVQLNNRSRLVEGAGLIAINFHAIYPNATMEAIMKKWEHTVYEYSLRTLNDSLIYVYSTSEGLVSEEVRRTGMESVPLMWVSFFVIVIFTVSTSLKRDPVRSKFWEALFGVFCPILSIGASFGTLFFLGFEFLPIVVVVPFLILAIGVDDVFIFLHCWAHSNPNLPLRDRVAEMMSSAGPSVTITSLTNFLSFAIGIGTPTPAIRTFCIYISTAVLMAYVYQFFYYTAVLTIGGRREEQGRNAYAPCIKVKNRKIKPIMNGKGSPSSAITADNGSSSTSSNVSPLSVSIRETWTAGLKKFGGRFLELWVDFLMGWTARIILGVVLCIYWAISTYGIMQIKVGLTSEKLFLDDSPLLKLVDIQTNIIFKEGGQMAVFVNNPGDLRRPDAVPELMRILERFEHAHKSVGPSSTQMWLNPYLPFIGLQNRGSIAFKYKYIPEFLQIPEYHRWSHFLNLGPIQDCHAERPSCINKFFFSTGFHGAVAWTERLELLQIWRGMASEYPHLNLSIYEDFAMYADQILSIPPVTMQTVGFALLCMAIVLVVFTPNYSTIIPGVLSVLSINLGVFGLLFYWKIDLDPISMTTTLMAIGLSVDFVAHISFHYYKGEIEDRRERLRHALVSIAWPMMQAALSTVLSLLVLATIHAYMVQVFVKVVSLVVFLGLIHGLIVLPIVYAAIPFKKATVTSSGEKGGVIANGGGDKLPTGPTKIAIQSTSPPLDRRQIEECIAKNGSLKGAVERIPKAEGVQTPSKKHSAEEDLTAQQREERQKARGPTNNSGVVGRRLPQGDIASLL